jgi:hypothetical protein
MTVGTNPHRENLLNSFWRSPTRTEAVAIYPRWRCDVFDSLEVPSTCPDRLGRRRDDGDRCDGRTGRSILGHF